MSKLDRLNLDAKSKKELKRLGTFYRVEAENCRKGKAFLASCIMMGSYLETLLVLIVHKRKGDVINLHEIPKKNLIDWGLSDLLKVAESLGWIPPQIDPKKGILPDHTTTLASLALLILDYRNLVHPGNFCQNYHGSNLSEDDFKITLDILFTTVQSLADRALGPQPKI